MDTTIDRAAAGRIADDLWALTPPQWDDECRYDDAVLSVVYRRVAPATDPEMLDFVIHLRDDARQTFDCVFHARATPCSGIATRCHLDTQVLRPGAWCDYLAALASPARTAAALATEDDEPLTDADEDQPDLLPLLFQLVEDLEACAGCQQDRAAARARR